jgi:uncharacterized protein with HEPN domain
MAAAHDIVDRAAASAECSVQLPPPQRAVHLIQIIVEAARQVSREFSDRHPEILSADIIGMLYKVVHNYLGVDEDIVWQVVTADLPTLVAALESIVPPTPPVTNGQ